MDNLDRPLRRSRSSRWAAGVLGGLAEHFDLDPTQLRGVYIVVSVLSAAFPGILVYIALWFVIPQQPD